MFCLLLFGSVSSENRALDIRMKKIVFLSQHATVDRVSVQLKAVPVLTAIRMTGMPDFIHKYYAGHCFARYTNISCKLDIGQHNIHMSSLPVFVSLLGLSL